MYDGVERLLKGNPTDQNKACWKHNEQHGRNQSLCILKPQRMRLHNVLKLLTGHSCMSSPRIPYECIASRKMINNLTHMHEVIRIYLGLYISIRPLNIDGPSNVLNWERHSEAAVDVRALSLFCKSKVAYGDMGNKELYKHLIEDNNTCTTTWRFWCTAEPPLIVYLHSSHISMKASVLHSSHVPVHSFYSNQELHLTANSLKQSDSWFYSSRLATVRRWTLLYQTQLNVHWIYFFSYYHVKLISTTLES